MSHAVKIDYEGISIQCQSICNMAMEQLCQLDRILNSIDMSASRLLDPQTKALRKEVSDTKKNLLNRIEAVLKAAKNNAKRGEVRVDSEHMGEHAKAYDAIDEAKELQKTADRLFDTKIVEYESLLDHLMSGKLASHQEKLKSLALGKTVLDPDVSARINSISSEVMRQYVYLAWVDDPDADFDKLCAAAARMKEKTDSEYYTRAENGKLAELRTRLKKEKISDETIEKIVARNGINGSNGSTAKERIRKATELAHSEIVSEHIRRESVKIIVNAIKKRGFYVDNSSIKIDRENNVVNILAQKPSGARAEFRVYLDGKFEYRFDGYEGQACQKDIQPFMSDLENVYGINVIKQTEIWKNPDKLSSMQQRTTDLNSNGNKE